MELHGSVPDDLTAAPTQCYLCGGARLLLRFPARRGIPRASSLVYACTSFGHRVHGPIFRCGDCGLIFLWPLPDPRAIADEYRNVEDPLYCAERENRVLTFRQVLRRLGPSAGRTLLDVGAYCGYFLEVAREAGFEVEGLELSRWAAAEARSLGLRVAETTLEEHHPDRGYDLITLWDVVEHFADPRAELRQVARLLRPGGSLYLSTIDTGSAMARLLGAHWPWLMEMHLFYFDRRTLLRLLAECGLEVSSVSTYTHVVSAGYLKAKLLAAFPRAGLPLAALSKLVPAAWPVPVNLGDNMLMVARKPTQR